MPRKLIKPSSTTPVTEADWYATPQGRRQTEAEFARALKHGTLSKSSGLDLPRTDPALLRTLLENARNNATRPVSIRIPVADIARARTIGSRRGIGYQTVLKEAIRAGLGKAS